MAKKQIFTDTEMEKDSGEVVMAYSTWIFEYKK